MQAIVVAKPYKFVPPRRGTFWPGVLSPLLPALLRSHGVTAVECRGAEKLAASVAAGRGVMLAPNHCRPCDPYVVAALGHAVGRHVHIMASWHLFMQGRMQRFLLTRAGIFSVYREGLDREALKCAIDILTEARRPLVLFPEGVISRHNDLLNPLMEGTAMIARNAAKQRAAQPGGRGVVIHPVGIRYFFEGDLNATVEPMLRDIEQRLTWEPCHGRPLIERIGKIGDLLHELSAPQNAWLNAHPRAANATLIVASAFIDLFGLYLLGSSLLGATLRPFLALVILFALRQLCQGLSTLPAPQGIIWRHPGFPSLLVTYDVGNDFFFSGHTAIAVLAVLELGRAGPPWLVAAAGLVAVFEVVTVIVLRAHYLVDVFAAAFVAWGCESAASRFAPAIDACLHRLF
jgi:1-acyl-sn-glycerol-3-phosphate acyltransferase